MKAFNISQENLYKAIDEHKQSVRAHKIQKIELNKKIEITEVTLI